MKRIIKKLIFTLPFIIIALISFSILKDNFSISVVQDACATCWGSACPGGNTTYYSTCPQSSAVIAGPIYSADVHVTISNSGTGIVPNGTRILINIVPAGGASPSCPDVTCLKRAINNYQAVWNGNGSIDLTFDTLGCSLSGTCTNNYVVTATFEDPNLGQTLNLNCPADQRPITLVNNSTLQAPIDLHCTSTQTYTCAGAGTIPPSATEQCQQQPTTSGCLDGWTPDPSKTCPQAGSSPNVCCVKTVCTTPAIPANVRVTCNGCQ